MNSFILRAVGVLARNPELLTTGDITYARFCLVGDDTLSEGETDGPRQVVTSLWFIAFGRTGECIAHHANRGDQLILEARICPCHWTDRQGERQHDPTFVVMGFRFGARRGDADSAVACRCGVPSAPLAEARAETDEPEATTVAEALGQ